MKLSVEAKVAVAVTASFMALTVGTITQGTSDNRAGEPNSNNSTNKQESKSNVIQQGHDSFIPNGSNVEESATRPLLWVDPIRL